MNKKHTVKFIYYNNDKTTTVKTSKVSTLRGLLRLINQIPLNVKRFDIFMNKESVKAFDGFIWNDDGREYGNLSFPPHGFLNVDLF